MSKIFVPRSLVVLLGLALTVPAFCQEQKFAEIGDLHLQSGAVIQRCRVGYRTFGNLNAQSSNAIVWPSWLLGRSEDIAANVGPGKLLDPAKYFVIAVDALGDGISSSPSNSTLQPRMSFPQFTIRDMVSSQHELLVHALGLNHVLAIVGQSMGGFQAYEWMVDYPSFMDKTVTIMGTPRAEASDILWTSAVAAAIRNDKDWNGGDYQKEPALTSARYMQLFAMSTPNQINATVRPEDTEKAIAQAANFGGHWDANDWLYQLAAVQSINIFGKESVQSVAEKVKSKVMIINGAQDLAVNASASVEFAKALGITPMLLASPCGHMAAGCESEKVIPAIQHFLQQ